MKRISLFIGLIGCALLGAWLIRPTEKNIPEHRISEEKPHDSLPDVTFSAATSPPAELDKQQAPATEHPKIKSTLSEPILILTGKNGKDTGYKGRLTAMRSLGHDLAPHDVEALMAFMKATDVNTTTMRPIELNSIRNDLMELLLRQHTLPDGIGNLLVEVLENRNHSSMWRNYCLQFMTPFYERRAQELSTSQPDTKKIATDQQLHLVKQAMWKALEERHNSNAGTALLGLKALSTQFPQFDATQVRAAMVDLAQDPTASEANRITALRLCGEHGHTETLQTARAVAQKADTIVLRCAAIATLGDLGTKEDRFLLENYITTNEPRIARIAQVALEKINNKH